MSAWAACSPYLGLVLFEPMRSYSLLLSRPYEQMSCGDETSAWSYWRPFCGSEKREKAVKSPRMPTMLNPATSVLTCSPAILDIEGVPPLSRSTTTHPMTYSLNGALTP